MLSRIKKKSYKESDMESIIFDKVLTLLVAGAILGSIIYGLYCLFGLIGCITCCSIIVALFFWIAEDIRHIAKEDQSKNQFFLNNNF